MGKHYYIHEAKLYEEFKAKSERIDKIMHAFKKNLQVSEIDIGESILISFQNNIKWEIEPPEILLCLKGSLGISWEEHSEDETRKFLEARTHIIVSEELEEFKVWDKFYKELMR